MTSELWFWILVIALAYGAIVQVCEHWAREREEQNEPDWRDEL